MDIEVKVSEDASGILVDGEWYPATKNNKDAWKEYITTKDTEKFMSKLSKVVLDFGVES